MDFTNYHIWIHEWHGSGKLLWPGQCPALEGSKELYTFAGGLKKLIEENRALHIPVHSKEERELLTDYFMQEFGIHVC